MDLEFDNLRIDIWPIGIVILVVLLTVLWRRKRSLSYLFCFSVFWMYLLFALRETLFPIPIAGEYADAMRKEVIFMSQVNLVPFYFGRFLDTKTIFPGIIQNIILTVPFGFGVSFVAPFRARAFLWLPIAVGLGLDVTQFVISLGLGFPYRVIDINDALLNTTGVFLGYGFFRVFAWLYLTMTQRLGIEHRGLPAYVYEVVRRTKSSEHPQALNQLSGLS